MTPNNLDPTGKKRFGILLFLTVFLLLPFLGLTLFNTKGELVKHRGPVDAEQ